MNAYHPLACSGYIHVIDYFKGYIQSMMPQTKTAKTPTPTV